MKTINDYAELVKEKHALNKTIAPVETDLTDASRDYHIGEQFINDGEIYKAKTEIAQHDALVLNTNYEPADNLTTQIKNAGGGTGTDPRLDVFENNIAPVETDETDASKAYQVGEQLILSNILYDVIAPISEHDVITTTGSGANIEPADPISSGIQTLTNQVDANTQAINGLATVASTGSYNDLSNKPSIPAAQVNSDWNASSGVAQILNKPTLGTAASKDSTTAVTSGSADLVTSGAVYTYSANKHKLTIKTVDTSGWSADSTSQSGTTLYKKSIALSHVYVAHPSVDIATSTGTGLPTTAQQTAYDLLQYVTVDGTTLYLYASAIPSTQFYIGVEGVD